MITAVEREAKRLYLKDYYTRNKEKNREKKLAYQRIYRFKNKEKINAKHRAYKRRVKYKWVPNAASKARKYQCLQRWRHANKEKCSGWSKMNREINLDIRRKQGRERYAINRDARTAIQRERNAKLKMELITAYGGSCTCCGEMEPRFLTLEHTNRDGKHHRAAVGGGYAVYRDLKKRGFPKGSFTILCMNCNFSEKDGKPCPHKTFFQGVLQRLAA